MSDTMAQPNTDLAKTEQPATVEKTGDPLTVKTRGNVAEAFTDRPARPEEISPAYDGEFTPAERAKIRRVLNANYSNA